MSEPETHPPPAGSATSLRVQTGLRMERPLLKVLKALAEYLDLTLADLVDGIVRHAFEGRVPFGVGTRRRIEELRQVYGMEAEGAAFPALDGASVASPHPPGEEASAVGWDDLDDGEFMAAFHSGSMARQPFRHEHHMRTAWLLLRREPLGKVAAEVRQGIGAIAAAHRAHDLYHETITQAFLHLVAAAIHGAPPGEDWRGFRGRNPELMAWPSPLLARHYSQRLLVSDQARHTFAAPDLSPLPEVE